MDPNLHWLEVLSWLTGVPMTFASCPSWGSQGSQGQGKCLVWQRLRDWLLGVREICFQA